MTLKLYGGARSRASIVQWYLDEIGVPYEFVLLDMQAGAHLQPDFLAINPMGKVPAIEDGDFKLWESGAILLYLADKHGKMPSSVEERATIAQWVLFANATLGPGIFIETSREKEAPRLLTPIDTILGSQPYFMGDEFGVVDVAVGSMLGYIRLMLNFDFSPYPAIGEYLVRIADRPAFQKAIGSRYQPT
jgi:glutathione S-transferase